MGKAKQNLKIDKFLLDTLVCPMTGGNLILSEKNNELVSLTAKLAYPIRDNIPIMVESEARKLTENELKSK